MSLFFATLFLVMFGGDCFWTLAVRRSFAGTGCLRYVRRAAYAFIALMAGALAVMMIGRIISVRLDAYLPRIVTIAVFVWHFIGLGIGLILGVPYVIGSVIARLTRKPPVESISITTVEPSEPTISRRALLARATAIAPAAVTLAATGVSAAQLNGFRVRELDVPIRDLPSALDGLTIAHLSDVHLGQLTTAATFRKIVAATNALDADLVLQTGDLINFDQSDLPVAAEFTHALRGKFGQFMCEGNHDLIEGRETFEAFVRKAKLPILINEVDGVTINGTAINVLGLPWMRVPRGESFDAIHRAALASLSAKRSTSAFPILLAHHPHAFDAAIGERLPLTLAGHTHGGQLHLTKHLGFGSLIYRYWSGLYQRDGAALVVSNGAGNWFPLRVNAPAEILRLTLRRSGQ